MNKKIIFTALVLGAGVVYTLRKLTASRSRVPQQGPAKMSVNVPKMISTDRTADVA